MDGLLERWRFVCKDGNDSFDLRRRRTQLSFYFVFGMFPDMPCMRRVYRDKRRPFNGLQPGTKSGRRPADGSLVNRSLCSFVGLHRVSFVRASEVMFGTVLFDALDGKRDGFFWANRPVGVPACPAPPCCTLPPRRPPSRPDPPVVYPGLGFDR